MGSTPFISPFESVRVVQAFLDYYHIPKSTIDALSLRQIYDDVCDESVENDAVADSRHADSLRSFFRPLGEGKVGDIHLAYRRFLAGKRNCPEGSPGKTKYDLRVHYNILAGLDIFTWPLLRYFLLSKDQRAVWGSDEKTRARSTVPIKILVMHANTILTGLQEGTINRKDYEVFRVMGEMILKPHARRKQDILMDLLTSRDRILGVKLLHMISWYEAAQNEIVKPTLPPLFEDLVSVAERFNVDQWHETLLSHFEKMAEEMKSSDADDQVMGKRIISFVSEENDADSRFKSLLYLVNASRFDLVERFLKIVNTWHEESFGSLDIWIHITAHLAASGWLHESQLSLLEFIIERVELYANGNLTPNEYLRSTSPFVLAFLDIEELQKMDDLGFEQYEKDFRQRHLGKFNGSGGTSAPQTPTSNDGNPSTPPASADGSGEAVSTLGVYDYDFEFVSDKERYFDVYSCSTSSRAAHLSMVRNTIGSMRVYYKSMAAQNVINNSLKMNVTRMPVGHLLSP